MALSLEELRRVIKEDVEMELKKQGRDVQSEFKIKDKEWEYLYRKNKNYYREKYRNEYDIIEIQKVVNDIS